MNATASAPQAIPDACRVDRFVTLVRCDLNLFERQKRLHDAVRLAVRFRFGGKDAAWFRCPVCKARIEVEATRDADCCITGSRGQCRTPNCLSWEDSLCLPA